MTIGKIYYLSTICGNLYWFLLIVKILLAIVAGVATACYIVVKLDSFQAENLFATELVLSKKCAKWTVIPLIFIVIASLFVPSKDDFLIIAMTKNYTPEQVYTMTKDELKNSIDYFVNQVNKVKKGY